MGFYFASCQPEFALRFIQKMYPDKTITWDDIPLLAALVSRDVLRVQDPDFHQPCQIVTSTKYKPEHKQEVDDALTEFRCNVHDK